jgi:iron complex transport system substrate-binding protein
MLVGVDDHSDYPPEVVKRLPRVGPDLEIDVEKVAALNPDLVLASLTVPGHERNIEALENAQLPFLAPEPTSLEDVYRDIRTVAKALGVPERAEGVIHEMKQYVAPIEEKEAWRPSILVQWWPKPVISPGRLSWTHDLLEAVGGCNPLGQEEIKSRPLTDEEVAELNPDAIVLSWCGVKVEKYRPEVIYRNESFAEIKAVKNQHVFSVSEEYMGRPSPRLLDGFRELREIVLKVRGERQKEG